jgi:DNA-binding NtrC family response regulator
VRELENCLTRAVVVCTGDVIRPEHLAIGPARNGDPQNLPTLADLEREHVERVLAATGGRKARAAAILGVSRPRLNRLIEKYGIGKG